MANFFFAGGSGSQQAINLDQVRLVKQDTLTGRVTIYFQPDHTIMLECEVAKQFMDVLGGRRSEAKALAQGAVKRGNKAAPTSVNPTPKPESYSTLKNRKL
jgi:hypothetical protein